MRFGTATRGGQASAHLSASRGSAPRSKTLFVALVRDDANAPAPALLAVAPIGAPGAGEDPRDGRGTVRRQAVSVEGRWPCAVESVHLCSVSYAMRCFIGAESEGDRSAGARPTFHGRAGRAQDSGPSPRGQTSRPAPIERLRDPCRRPRGSLLISGFIGRGDACLWLTRAAWRRRRPAGWPRPRGRASPPCPRAGGSAAGRS